MKQALPKGLVFSLFIKNKSRLILGLALLSSLALPATSMAQRPDRQDHPNTHLPDREVNRSNNSNRDRDYNPNRNNNNDRNNNHDRNSYRDQDRNDHQAYARPERNRTSYNYPDQYRNRDLAYNNRRDSRAYRPVYHPAPNHYRGPNWHYRNLPRWGYTVPMAPRTSVTIAFGGVYFHYDNGVYYRPMNGRYVVVPAPIGLRTRVIPAGHLRFFINYQPYYYYYGTYYRLYNGYYEVVKPPVGALVESIPDGYEQVVIDGETYYIVDGVQYKPVLNNNEIWYEVLKVD